MAKETFLDGRYYAEGLNLYRAPLKKETGVTLGFHIAIFNDEDHAEAVADALNRDEALEDMVKALKATEALDNREGCPECEGEGEPEICELCFEKADNARLMRRAALAKAKPLDQSEAA